MAFWQFCRQSPPADFNLQPYAEPRWPLPYPESESGLSKFPLIWMVDEAVKAGLRITESNFRHLAWGEAHADGEHEYVAPSSAASSHQSLNGGW